MGSSRTYAAGTGVVNNTNVCIRKGPGTNYDIMKHNGTNIMLSTGETVGVIESASGSDALYPNWYKISFTYGGTPYEGYICADYLTVTSTGDTNNDSSSTTDGDFETYLASQGFPESYKVKLRALHAKYPNWIFKAVNTGLDWNTVIENESSRSGYAVKNTVYGSGSAQHYNWRSTDVGYNWTTDSWYSYDGNTWFAASTDLIRYYMDPRNSLDEKYIFQFESLNYVPGGQTEAGVEAILNGGFMYNTIPADNTLKYSTIIVNTAAATGVSPYYIASKIKQEVGNSIGTSTSGTNSEYPGIYNFYNIGAYDSSDGTAAIKGLKWASGSGSYGRPWNTREKSIVGGATYIGESYIKKGQNTGYFQKFNVVVASNLYNHQYMTNVQAASNEGLKSYTAYNTMGMLNSTITFNIPIYNNMPELACVKPADSGNPNNWLKTLDVSGYSLTPTFGINATNDYSLIVPADVTSINISGTTVNSKAKVSGTGTIGLNEGTNYIPVTVQAENGNVRTYNLTIVRGQGGSNSLTFGNTYTIGNGMIKGVSPDTTVDAFKTALGAPEGATVSVVDSKGNAVTGGNVGTGSIVTVTYGASVINSTIIVYGDVSGDGKINSLDLLKVQKHILGVSILRDAFLEAANVKHSGNKITSLDLLKVQKHILGINKISQ